MAKLIKRLGKGLWNVQEFSHSPILKRKVYREVNKFAEIERWVIINNRRVKVFYDSYERMKSK